MSDRRTFLQRVLGMGAGLLAGPSLLAQAGNNGLSLDSAQLIKRDAIVDPGPAFSAPVITTDVGDLPFTMDGRTKVFHLIAEVFQQKLGPDKTIAAWGFNGSAPGPTIQVNQGDHVRVIFDNRLPEQTSMHWHGFEDKIRYDGMPGISQQPVKPGGRFIYEFDIHQEGTYFYHSHMAMQEMAGMLREKKSGRRALPVLEWTFPYGTVTRETFRLLRQRKNARNRMLSASSYLCVNRPRRWCSPICPRNMRRTVIAQRSFLAPQPHIGCI